MVTKVLIVNPQRIARDSIANILSEVGGFGVVAQCCSIPEALKILPSVNPDVIVVDVAADNFNQLKHFGEVAPGVMIVASGLTLNEDSIIACARSGATGYIDLDATTDEWVNTISAAIRGETANPKIAGILIKYLSTHTTSPTPHEPASSSWRVSEQVSDSAKRVGLTPRERQIVGLIDKGLSNKEIARELNLEPSTIKNHVHAILGKYRVRRRSEAAKRFRESAVPKIVS